MGVAAGIKPPRGPASCGETRPQVFWLHVVLQPAIAPREGPTSARGLQSRPHEGPAYLPLSGDSVHRPNKPPPSLSSVRRAPTSCSSRTHHSQYLTTAMLTGAVQVTTTIGFSEAMAEEQSDPNPRPPAFQTRAAAGPAIGPRRPTCSRVARLKAGLAHAPLLNQ